MKVAFLELPLGWWTMIWVSDFVEYVKINLGLLGELGVSSAVLSVFLIWSSLSLGFESKDAFS